MILVAIIAAMFQEKLLCLVALSWCCRHQVSKLINTTNIPYNIVIKLYCNVHLQLLHQLVSHCIGVESMSTENPRLENILNAK